MNCNCIAASRKCNKSKAPAKQICIYPSHYLSSCRRWNRSSLPLSINFYSSMVHLHPQHQSLHIIPNIAMAQFSIVPTPVIAYLAKTCTSLIGYLVQLLVSLHNNKKHVNSIWLYQSSAGSIYQRAYWRSGAPAEGHQVLHR
jgi:hypothetical protein